MTELQLEDKLRWHLEQLPGVVEVSLAEKDHGLFRVSVNVEPGQVDLIWDELVHQVDDFERSLGGNAGLDLEIGSPSEA